MKPSQLGDRYLRHIFDVIQDGIIIMDQNRKILTMNPAAEKLTGWKLYDNVPYCSYCESNRGNLAENKCYLIAREEVPYFLSTMPTYHGKKINVEMSTALIFQENKKQKKEYLLVLRHQGLKEKEKEAQLSKQMIQMLLEAQENEHKRLAQELHDGVGQSLYSISVALQAIESFVEEEEMLHYFNDVREELDQVMNDVKTYAYQLRPQSLDSLGLVAAVQELIQSLEKSNPEIAVTFISNLGDTLSSSVKINLYRVIQEAILNIIKYARATKAAVELMMEDDQLILRINDNGVGFDLEKMEKYGLGLKHMEERMNQIGGNFFIESARGKGTSIIASIAKGETFHD